MNRFPKITPGESQTYNRKFRRALQAMAVRVPSPQRAGRGSRVRHVGAKRRYAQLSNLVGNQHWPGHDGIVLGFLAGLQEFEKADRQKAAE